MHWEIEIGGFEFWILVEVIDPSGTRDRQGIFTKDNSERSLTKFFI